MSRTTKIGIVTVALATAGVVAFAANTMENDATALASAQVSLSQAISSAEQHTGGKAARAEFEHTRTGWVYDVEIVNGSKKVDVRVDPTSGTVISVVDDKMDRDDEHDEDD